MLPDAAPDFRDRDLPLRVCVIEEDDAVRDALCALLQACGYDVLGLARAEAPLCDGPIDCLILAADDWPDVQSAGTGEFLAARPELPVILMTRARQPAAFAGRGRRLVGVLQKPFQPDRLLQMLPEALPAGASRSEALPRQSFA